MSSEVDSDQGEIEEMRERLSLLLAGDQPQLLSSSARNIDAPQLKAQGAPNPQGQPLQLCIYTLNPKVCITNS